MSVTAHCEDLAYGECKIDLRFLRNKCDAASQLPSSETVDRFPINQHFAVIGTPEARK
jgi:hypothetical protein